MAFAIASISAYAKPHCQSFNNYDDKVTIIFADESADNTYSVSVNNGVATATLTFDHLTQFSDPKVELKINGKTTTFKVCH